MDILKTVMPVIIMLALGKIFAIKKIISAETVTGIKGLISGALLPVVIFNALLSMQFSMRSLSLSLLVYVLYTIALFLVLKFISPRLKYRMSGFLMLGAEGGMMGYALYTSLFGSEALATLMEVDLGNILFAFTFFIVLIKMANSDEKDTKKVIVDSLKTPLVSVVAIALVLNVMGIGEWLMSSQIGSLYTAVINMVTSPVSALILMSVGYELELDPALLKDVGTVSIIRLLINALIALVLLTAGRFLIISDQLMTAVLIYAILPPQFITPIFIKDTKQSSFAATVLSFYTLITIAGYIILAAIAV
ncbi:MAG: hypothetical protein IJ252_10225 [Solobacterium sp.]|nr:hypothetical protein [Solobacterium sp.]